MILNLLFVTSFEDERKAQLVAAPRKGDVYEVQEKFRRYTFRRYTLYKVERVAGDTVFLLPHRYMTDEQDELHTLKQEGDSLYGRGRLPIVKRSLKAMLEGGKIVGVERP